MSFITDQPQYLNPHQKRAENAVLLFHVIVYMYNNGSHRARTSASC